MSIVIGIYSGYILVGGSLLISGLLSSYLASIGKKSSYVFGFINALLMAYVAYKNNLFGSFVVDTFIFAPLEVYGFVSWGHNLDKKKNVKIRKFTLKDSITVISIFIFGSVILGYLLTLIPCQQMAFLDSTINCIDICALVLINLRFKESWWLWIDTKLFSFYDNVANSFC